MTPAMQELAGQVWDARDARRLKRDPLGLARALIMSAAQDVRQCEVYDPEMDVRVTWLRELIEDMRRGPGWRMPRASVNAEYLVMMLLGRLERQVSGKERAAGAA
jgi:hypothetical protein